MKREKVFRLLTFTAIVATVALLASCTLENDDNTTQSGTQTGVSANEEARLRYAEARITGFHNACMRVINGGGATTYQEFYANALNLKNGLYGEICNNKHYTFTQSEINGYKKRFDDIFNEMMALHKQKYPNRNIAYTLDKE